MGDRTDLQCREIFTRAVCARGQKADEQIHTIQADALRDTPEEVLGCRVSGHRLQASYERAHAAIRGEYELQVWVSYASDSDLIRDRVNYRIDVPLAEIGEGVGGGRPEVNVDVVDGPTAVEFGLDKEGNVEVVVSLVLRVAVFAETRLFVRTCEPPEDLVGGHDLDDEWDWVEDEEAAAPSRGPVNH